MATVASGLMTTEQLLALPDDGVERWLIDGQLRENGMTVLNRVHARAESRVGYYLNHWLLQQPEPRGDVFSGEAGVMLARNPDVTVGVDVVYITKATLTQQSDVTTLIEATPTLAVEISSPSEVKEMANEKIRQYLCHGVPLVWVVDPDFQTVTVYERGQPPRMVNVNDTLTAEPHLPGFSVRVIDLFRS